MVSEIIDTAPSQIMDDKIFGSMMQSSRRFTEIEINVDTAPYERPDLRRSTSKKVNEGEAPAKRIVALLEKFQPHMNRLMVWRFPDCSSELFTKFLETTTGVEEMRLTDSERSDRRYLLQTEFSKLKKLTLCNSQENTAILDKVRDDSLEVFNVWVSGSGNLMNGEKFQAFLNRQRKLKQLRVPSGIPNLNHLALTQLTFGVREHHQVALMLENQTSLRRLHVNAVGIDDWPIEESSEVPSAGVTVEDVELMNLIELRVDIHRNANYSVLRQVVFPKLVKLALDLGSLDSERLIQLSRDLKKSAQNVQHIEIRNRSRTGPTIDYVPTIVEVFPALKTLHVDLLESRPNQSLEELIFRNYNVVDRRSTSFYDAINSCSNLKRIQLFAVHVSEQQILGVVRNHPHLTHFWCLSARLAMFSGHTEENLDPVLAQVINVFRNSQNFLCLSLLKITDWRDQQLEDMLAEDAERIIVSKYQHWSYDTCLSLTKKSEVPDPFENFHEKRITRSF